MLTRSNTLAEAVLPLPRGITIPRTRIPAYVLRNVALVVAFATIIALCGRARFFLGDNPVPISLQTFGVLLTGAALGSRLGLASILLFYFAGMAGAPVFQGGNPEWTGFSEFLRGNNAWDYVSSSPTGGYLIGFIAATYVVGFLSERGLDRRDLLWALVIGSLLIYIPGMLWLGAKDVYPWGDVVSKGMLPFLPGDAFKLMMVGVVVRPAWAIVNLRRR